MTPGRPREYRGEPRVAQGNTEGGLGNTKKSLGRPGVIHTEATGPQRKLLETPGNTKGILERLEGIAREA